jgi:hypothetical protein
MMHNETALLLPKLEHYLERWWKCFAQEYLGA